jgi:hypothetical protein
MAGIVKIASAFEASKAGLRALKPFVASLIKPIQGAILQMQEFRYSPHPQLPAPSSELCLLASSFRMV